MDLPEKGADRPSPPAFGAAIPPGLGVNLLVRDVEAALRWQVEALEAEPVYWEDHFAVLRRGEATWLLHSDWSYRDHAMSGAVAGVEARGAGIELRLYGLDPDAAEARVRAMEGLVLAGAADKPHGLREAHLVDRDGYVWVPCRPSASG
jgi:catechol 2,3-dioxygenase-like lactoylglutathione lyase family enzyme